MLNYTEKNLRIYLAESLGLGLFMISACVFASLLEYPHSPVNHAINNATIRLLIMAAAMGTTASLIIYSSFGKLSGAHLNPAVTFSFFILGKVKFKDFVSYSLFQLMGGVLAVSLMNFVLGEALHSPQVNFVVTIPMKENPMHAFITECSISFIMIVVMLWVSNTESISKYTGIVAGFLVACFVFVAGPISGFSMNPARTLASSIPSGNYYHLWIYMTAPFIGMITGTFVYKSIFKNVICAKICHSKTHDCIFNCEMCYKEKSSRLPYIFSISFILFLCLLPFHKASSQTKVNGVNINVTDLKRSIDFYTKVLTFNVVAIEEHAGENYETLKNKFGIRYKVAKLQLGDEFIYLTDYLTAGGNPIPHGLKSNDLSFQHIAIVVSNMSKAYEKLRNENVTFVSTHPQTLPSYIKPAAGITAFYFQDPDKHTLELIHFPSDKGKAKWQKQTKNLFLGIDHTAIGVSRTRESIDFYKILNVDSVGQSINFGNEQAHLNNVKNAKLKITGCTGIEGFGIEFLEYLEPKSIQLQPLAIQADDIIRWETILEVDNLQSVIDSLQSKGTHVLQSNVTEFTWFSNSYKGVLINDPDGHVLALYQKL